eukprot:PhF_6_TR40390/c0_g1_i5/m.60170/K07588/argK; LAO/AO transport system kinase
MELLAGLQAGKLRALSKAITLIESSNPTHQLEARTLLKTLYSKHKANNFNGRKTYRIGITGSPGAGKSTFLNSFAEKFALQDPVNNKVAILAIDPSSVVTGGSVLGDKTRMEKLTVLPNVYVRPSPSGSGYLGGLNATCEDAITLCEEAGFQYIFVETVGVGQSEAAVRNVCDTVLMLIPPAAGDNLQGMKRGLLDVVDFVVITKYDGSTKALAQTCYSEYTNALRLLGRRCHVVSAVEGTNMDTLMQDLIDHQNNNFETHIVPQRQKQRVEYFRRVLFNDLANRVMQMSEDKGKMMDGMSLREVEKAVGEGDFAPRCAAHDFVDILFRKNN